MINSKLHCAATLLNRYLLQGKELASDLEATAAADRVVKVLSPLDVKDDVVQEVWDSCNGLPPFHKMDDTNHPKLRPFGWWDLWGSVGKQSAPISKRISSSSS